MRSRRALSEPRAIRWLLIAITLAFLVVFLLLPLLIVFKQAFGHGVVHTLPNGQTLIGCYHPSRQNTNTGKLTARMMDEVFLRTQEALRSR